MLLAPLRAKPCVFTMVRTQRMAGIMQLMTRIRCDTHEMVAADIDGCETSLLLSMHETSCCQCLNPKP